MTATLKANCADCFWDSLSRTYSDSRYCDLDQLPQALQDAIWSADNLTVECSSYTVGEHAAFLRGTVTVDGEDYEFEVSFGSLESGGDERDDDGQLVDRNGEPLDEDEYYESMAAEVFACSALGGATVYFTPV